MSGKLNLSSGNSSSSSGNSSLPSTGSSFDFKPATSPDRKTTVYSVPSGKYAKATLSFYGPRVNSYSYNAYGSNTVPSPNWITINGINTLVEKCHVINMSWSWNYDPQCALVFASGFSAIAHVSYYIANALNTNPTFSISGISINNTNAYQKTAQIITKVIGGETCNIYSNGNGTGSRTSSGAVNLYLNNPSVPDQIEVWLKAGDIISSTGGNWQAIVTEYNSAS